ncbi:MAG: hypothetical protein LBQ61_09660, partial [Spirochaetales bacterium]|nr:hypothetical protein [Spirochaetales bacterium]
TGVPVYGINQVAANVLFDENGKILALYIDQLEVVTPNYDGPGAPHFSGFPGQGGYNQDEDHDGKIEGLSADSRDHFLAEIDGWITKRERGEGYHMVLGSWQTQMDFYQSFFTGKTAAEIEDWFRRYCSDINGRPLKITDSSDPADSAKYDALSRQEKDMLADVVSGATISLNDSHGNIIAAISTAYENRKPVVITGAERIGIGIASNGRLGPGADDQNVPVYSFNEVFANTVFDAEGRITAISIDSLEVATPNYDGEGMPHLSGLPGQKPYNADLDHDGRVETTITPTQETFLTEIGEWITKRDRGDGYHLVTGNWASQMNVFESLFIGKTAAEVEEWFEKYCSDINGRPLRITDSSDPADSAKYDALNQQEKDMLADVVSGATISLNDSHGNMIAAVRKSFENAVPCSLTGR